MALGSGETIGQNPVIQVLASDNAGLDQIVLEYREADGADAWHAIATEKVTGTEASR